MEELPEIRDFDPEHLCPRCGTEGNHPEHHERPVFIAFGTRKWPCWSLARTLKEHFCLRCTGCGYSWIERVSPGMAPMLG